jgi:hypothetical protein
MNDLIVDKLKYKEYLPVIKNDTHCLVTMCKGKQSLKMVGDILYEKVYTKFKSEEVYIKKNIEEIEIYRKKINDKISSDRVFVFNDLLSKSKNRSEVINALSELLNEKVTLKICDKEIDLKNINYNLYEKELNNSLKEVEFFKKAKKIKLKELTIIKRNIKNLSYYSSFLKKYNLKSPVLNSHSYSHKKFKIDFLNLFHSNSSVRLLTKLNNKYSKTKENRDFLQDEIKYQMFVLEKNKIKCDLKVLSGKSAYWNSNTIKYKKLREEILELKDDKLLYKHLKKFFSLHFNNENLLDYLHNFYKDENTKFNLTNDIAIAHIFSNILESLEEDLIKIQHVGTDVNYFIRLIRLQQYQRRNKTLNIDFSMLENDVEEFFSHIEEKMNFFHENKDILLKAEMNKKFNSWEDSYSYILSKFLENHEFFKGVVYIFKDKLGKDLITSILESFDKKYLEINFDSLIDIIKEVKTT